MGPEPALLPRRGAAHSVARLASNPQGCAQPSPESSVRTPLLRALRRKGPLVGGEPGRAGTPEVKPLPVTFRPSGFLRLKLPPAGGPWLAVQPQEGDPGGNAGPRGPRNRVHAGCGSRRREGGVRPASRGLLPKRPCTERVDAPLPARRPTEAYSLRYGEGGQRSRSGCSAPRMPGSEGMAPWRPERSRAGSSHGEPRTEPPPRLRSWSRAVVS